MKFFVDTAEIADIKELAATGLLDGVTTNPSLVAKSGKQFLDLIAEICDVVEGPVSAEVTSADAETMMKEGLKLSKIAKNVCVKLPLTQDGLFVCKKLTDQGIKTNVTLCFSPAQALLAAKAGATYISPFVGRVDDIGSDGMQLIADIVQIYENYDYFTTQVLVASVRGPAHVIEAAKIGAHVATMPPSVIKGLLLHPLTEKGLASFTADWKKTGQSIL